MSLAAEVFLLELLEIFLGEHGALRLLLLLFGHRPVTGLAAPVLAHDLEACGSQDTRKLHTLAQLAKCCPSPGLHTCHSGDRAWPSLPPPLLCPQPFGGQPLQHSKAGAWGVAQPAPYTQAPPHGHPRQTCWVTDSGTVLLALVINFRFTPR